MNQRSRIARNSRPTVGEALPSLREAAPAEVTAAVFAPDEGHGLGAALQGIALLLDAAEQRSIDELETCAQELMRDLAALRPGPRRVYEVYIEFLIFAVCAITADALTERGETLRTWIWTLRALGDGDDEDGPRWDLHLYRVEFWDMLLGPLRAPAVDLVTRWLTVLYGYAWSVADRGPGPATVPTAADRLAYDCFDLAAALLDDDDAWRIGTPLALIHMAGHRLQWAGVHEVAVARAAYADLARRAEAFPPESIESFAVRSLAAVTEWPLTDRSQAVVAQELLDEDRVLMPPMRLRLLCGSCDGRLDRLLERLPAIVGAALDHREHRSASETSAVGAYRRSSDWTAVTWALRTLIVHDHLPEALELLDAWAVRPREGELLHHPLFVLPSVLVGTVWSAHGWVAPDPDGPPAGTLHQLSEIAQRALNHEFVLPLDVDATVDARVGYPEEDHAAEFVAAARSHLRLDELGANATALPPDTAVVSWPALSLPLQALMQETLGHAPPLSASLRQPQACRAVQRAWVMGRGSATSEIERDAVTALLRGAGAHVEVREEASHEAFLRAYADDCDLIWPCSHAAYDHLVPHHTGLVLDDGEHLTLEQLDTLRQPAAPGRRLLMLNVCDAGSSNDEPGAMALGIAAELAGPRQTVIGHLWPVHFLPASVFGVLMAAGLVAGPSHELAYNSAMSTMRGGRVAIIERLREIGEPAENLVARVENSTVPLESVFAWGSAALVL